MLPKKSNRANLEKAKPVFLQIGLIVALSIMLAAFEWSTKERKTATLKVSQAENIIQEEIPCTRYETKKQEIMPVAPVVLNITSEPIEPGEELQVVDMTPTASTSFAIVDFKPETEEPEKDDFFYAVEDMPKFKGGDLNTFCKYIAGNIEYPGEAAVNGVEGTVNLSFVVDETGKVTRIKIIRGVNPDLDKEAIRVVGLSPDWEPGRQSGKAVKVKFSIPIPFRLDR